MSYLDKVFRTSKSGHKLVKDPSILSGKSDQVFIDDVDPTGKNWPLQGA